MPGTTTTFGKLSASLAPFEAPDDRVQVPYVSILTLIYLAEAVVACIALRVHGYPDYPYYTAMTAGNWSGVTEPFASRVLGPALAFVLGNLAHVTPASALSTVCFISWSLIGLPIGLILHRARVPLAWAIVVATVPFQMLDASFYQVPDGLAVLLVLAFLLFWERQKIVEASLVVPFAILARNTSIVGMTLWLFASKNRTVRQFALVAVGLVAGILIKKALFDHHSENVHALNPMVYYVSKVPVNLLGNIFGLHPYAQSTVAFCSRPLATFSLPPLSVFGHVRALGICPFTPGPIVYSLICYAFIFGLFPWILFHALWRGLALIASNGEDMKRKCLAFLVLFFLAPGFGLTIARLFVESFPLLIPLIAAGLGTIPIARRNTACYYAMAYNIVGSYVFLRV